MEKVLPHLAVLGFVLSREIIAWSADIEPTSSLGDLCCVFPEMKEISGLLPSLKLYRQN